MNGLNVRGGGVLEGKEGHLYASVGVFLCCFRSGAAGAQVFRWVSACSADTCRRDL